MVVATGQRKVGWSMKKLKVDKEGGKAKNQKVVGTEMERILGNEAVTGYEAVVKREVEEG